MTANASVAKSVASPAKSPVVDDQSGSRDRLSAPAKQLMRFLAGVMIFCGIACLYFAQLSEITAIRRSTAELRQEAMHIEHANAALMQEVAAWNRPDYIQNRAGGLGLGPAGEPAYVELPASAGRGATAARQPESISVWQQLQRELQKSWANVMAVPRDVAQVGR